jgi:hypothetical protein
MAVVDLLGLGVALGFMLETLSAGGFCRLVELPGVLPRLANKPPYDLNAFI